jgi:SAM-dependent methyltransferase
MTGAALKVVHDGDAAPPLDIGWLAEAIRQNRFLPMPPDDRLFVGDGDYRAIGAEFLRHFVEIGGLRRDAHVLDIGCGTGRLAVPLTQYLDPQRGAYDGVDPVRWGIDWCAANITPHYPAFRFQHLDIRHAIYNPEGRLDGSASILPIESGSVDFAAMVSVVTHLPAAEVRRYAHEVERVLVPGGTLLLTTFVLDRDGPPKSGGDPRLKFTRRAEGEPEWVADRENPTGAVGFDDGFIEEMARGAGMAVREKSLGSWSGRSARHYQDIFVIEKGRSGR